MFLELHAISKLALRAQTVEIADITLRQDLLPKNDLKITQRNFCLSNNLFKCQLNPWMRCSEREKQEKGMEAFFVFFKGTQNDDFVKS